MEQPDFEKILSKVTALVEANPDDLLLRICTLLKEEVYHYDWVGFYVLDPAKNELALGPYAGKPTEHTRIAVGKGVCGQVATNCQTMVVQDVTQIDNYISCSIDVQSEIVAPVLKNGRFVAEIDIDSHSPAPFTPADSQFLETVCQLVANKF